VIVVVDYGMGNVRSLSNALQWLGADCKVSAEASTIRAAERVILPGVGAFGDAMAAIRERRLDRTLQECVRSRGTPMLGICLGMQLLAKSSNEHGAHEGLGWFDATVERFELPPTLKIPHIGWNSIHYADSEPLFSNVPADDRNFYFVHSFRVRCRDAADVLATCRYGEEFAAAIRRGNVVATQFHPEKSQDNGLSVLRNFLEWNP
jgi:glutamine amidotransferase